jgi:hypothetical protein
MVADHSTALAAPPTSAQSGQRQRFKRFVSAVAKAAESRGAQKKPHKLWGFSAAAMSF